MKPTVGILGVWHPSDSALESPFKFVDLGRAHVTCPGLTPDKLKQWQSDFDLIIVAPFGYDACWVSSYMIGLRGGRCKLAMWSFDSHNPGWAEREHDAAWLYNRWFTAHSFCMKIIGDNAAWMPCACVWHGVNDLPIPDPQQTRWLDVASCSRPYYGTNRENIILHLREYLDLLGRNFILGECNPLKVIQFYQQAKVCLNVNQNSDLNIRFFEGLAANCTMLMTPANDAGDGSFRLLRDSVLTMDRMIRIEDFGHIINQALERPYADTRSIIQQKHMLFHRYVAIAESVLT